MNLLQGRLLKKRILFLKLFFFRLQIKIISLIPISIKNNRIHFHLFKLFLHLLLYLLILCPVSLKINLYILHFISIQFMYEAQRRYKEGKEEVFQQVTEWKQAFTELQQKDRIQSIQLNKLRKSSIQFDRQIIQLQQQIIQKNKRQIELLNRISYLESQLSHLCSQHNIISSQQTHNLNQKMNLLESTVIELQQQRQGLIGRAMAFQSTSQQAMQYKRRAQQYQRQVQKSNIKCLSLTQQLQQKQLVIQQVHQSYHLKHNMVQQIIQQLKGKQDQNQQNKKEIQSIHERLLKQETQITNKTNALNQTKREIESLAKATQLKLHSNQQLMKQLQKEIENQIQQKNQVIQDKNHIYSLLVECQQKIRQINKEQRTFGQMSRKIEIAQQRCRAMGFNLWKKEQVQGQYKDKIEVLQIQLNHLKKRVMDIFKQNSVIKLQNNKLRGCLSAYQSKIKALQMYKHC